LSPKGENTEDSPLGSLFCKVFLTGSGAMRGILKYLSSQNGRTARFLTGAVLISAGLFVSPIMIVVGLLPFFAAIFDVCLFAPFFKLPFEGEKLRDELSDKR